MQARSYLLFLTHRSLWLLAIGVCDLSLSAAQLAPQPATTPLITQPSEPQASELPKIVEKLAAQPTLSAADCATLARETIAHGQAARQSGQPVKPSILHDGLAAVDQGESIDAKAADWADLRSQLQELLKPQQDKKDDEKKEEQKKDEQQKQQDQNKDQQKQDEQKSEDQKKEQKQDEQQEQQSEQQKQEQEKKQQEQQQQSQAQQPDKPEPPKETQTVGGEKPKDDERKEHPELAVPLQKLDQVRDKDSPAELFQLLQTDEPAPAGQPKKDW